MTTRVDDTSQAVMASGVAFTGAASAAWRQVGVIGLGVIALLSQGLSPALLGALGAAHRISTPGIGMAAAGECLAITVASALAAIFIRPNRLRTIGVSAAGGLTLAVFLGAYATTEMQQIGLRVAAGVAEGLLFWIAMEGVARARLPERAAGMLMAAVTVATLLAAAAATEIVLPRFGANGGFLALAGLSAAGAIFSLLISDSHTTSSEPKGQWTLPGLAGWVALLAALLFNAAGMGFLVYVVPLAEHANLGAIVAGRGLTALIAGQLVGALLAAGIAGRVNHLAMLAGSAIAYLVIWPLYGVHADAGLFIAVCAAHGFITFLALPFLYPVTIVADPSRQAAVLIGPAQMLGTALGPLLGSAVVGGGDVVHLIPLGDGLLLMAMAVIAGLVVWGPRALT